MTHTLDWNTIYNLVFSLPYRYMAAAAQNSGLEISGVYPFASPNTGGKDAWLYGDGAQSWPKRYKYVVKACLLVRGGRKLK